MLPIAEAVRLADALFARHAVGGQVFVRPDSVDKSFNGTLSDRPTLTHKFLGAGFDPQTLILVARPKRLAHEWRVIVANGRVVTGSQYRNAAGREDLPGCPEEVIRFLGTVLDRVAWCPAPMFVMDVCDSEEGIRVLELNSFGCSGHYAADLSQVVRVASDLASYCW